MYKLHIFIVFALFWTSGVYAKKLSKDEIKNIIFQASKHKGKYSVKAKIKKGKKRTKTAAKTKRKKSPVPTVSKKEIVTKKTPVRILPFQLAPSIKSGDVKIDQKGFVLIKGEPVKKIRKLKNPLYKL